MSQDRDIDKLFQSLRLIAPARQPKRREPLLPELEQYFRGARLSMEGPKRVRAVRHAGLCRADELPEQFRCKRARRRSTSALRQLGRIHTSKRRRSFQTEHLRPARGTSGAAIVAKPTPRNKTDAPLISRTCTMSRALWRKLQSTRSPATRGCEISACARLTALSPHGDPPASP
jgi:hypothetical protein